jgi:hypothetical protein
MKSRIKVTVLFFAILLLVIPSPAKEKPGSRKGLSKVTAGQPLLIMNANNITTWVQGNGFFPPYVQQSWNGEFPKGSGVGCIFQEGIVFGGFVNDGLYSNTLRVTGDAYAIGMQAGAFGDDPAAATSRAFGVRPDLPPSDATDATKWPDLTVDAATYFQIPQASVSEGQKQQIAAAYFKDWTEWPAAKGAPWFIDTVKAILNDNAALNIHFDPTNPHDIPGVPGASKTIWFVCNDQDPSTTLTIAGSPPLGVEEQMTLWAYASSTPLNNIIFKQVKLIYKGNPGSPANARIDSLFVVQWADPDEGDYGDDFAGSDSALNLNFDYNSKTLDAKYAAIGVPAPAIGYVFLQGVSHYTGVAADSAVVNFGYKHGYKYWHERNGLPTPLTSATYFAAGSPWVDPDQGVYAGTQQWFNLMRGDLPRPQYPAGEPFWQASPYASSHGIVTSYVLSGDPVTGQGWVDGLDVQASDRRLVTVHGPVTMNKGDTAEVVTALVGGIGADNLGSVKVLKYNTTYAQFAYNSNFNLPAPPPSPKTSASALDGKVVLNWGGDAANVNTIESSDNSGFAFEGYNVYQLPSGSATVEAGVRIATYDKIDNVTIIVAPALDPVTGVIITKPVEFGSDKGISRSIVLTQDYIKQAPLVNGQVYFYAVTAYSYNPNWNNNASVFQAPFPSLESAPIVVNVEPASTKPGVRFGAGGGDSLAVGHTNSAGGATSDGSVTAVVVQPDQMTGDTYNVTFDAAGTWTVTDASKGAVKLTGTNQSGDANYLTVDGVQIIVQGPPPGLKQWSIPAGARKFSPVGGFTGVGLEGFSTSADQFAYDPTGAAGTIGWAHHFAFGSIGTTLTNPSQVHSVLLKLAAVTYSTLWDPLTAQADPNFSLGYRWLRHAAAAAADPAFAPWIINAASGYAYQDFNYSVPFSAWDVDVTPPVRLAVGMFENNDPGATVDGRYWPPQATGGDNTVNREFCFIFGAPYSTTDDPTYHVNLSGNSSLPMMYVMTCNIRNTSNWSGTDEFLLTAAKVNGPNDVFSYVAPKPTYNQATAQADVNKINVFPNPYYGMNTSETNRLSKYVRFNHLPASATIRIFTLAGVLVRTLPTTDGTTTFADWNLRNDNSLPVASGVYIAFIDMPGIGKTKTLKIAIVQEEQILPTY